MSLGEMALQPLARRWRGAAAPEGAAGACINTCTRSHGQVTRADSFGSGDCAVSAVCGLFCLELFLGIYNSERLNDLPGKTRALWLCPKGIVVGHQVLDHGRDVPEASPGVRLKIGVVEDALPFLVDAASDPSLQVARLAAMYQELAREFLLCFFSS